MATCPKCFKQSPEDAAFCGFCGAKMVEPAVSAGAKTMFGVAGPTPAPAPAPAPAPTQPAGAATDAVAGRYVPGDLVRRLPAGELRRAHDLTQQTAVEILLVDKVVFQSPLDMERARRELRQLQKVECPAIVRVLDHGKAQDDRLFVVMEPVAASSLDEVVSRGPMDLAQAQHVIKGVGTGLAEAQKMGVIHRDIAPHNILLCSDGSIKVRGFGVAAPIKRHVWGTPEFISPEQAAGRPVDQRSNIYSLGVLMYYMLMAEPPFAGDDVDAILERHQKEEPPSLRQRRPDLASRAETLILKALAKSSSRRHLTLRQFLREVDSVAVATGPLDEISDTPLSFETPLHGVTALKGGQEPPPSSEPRFPTMNDADMMGPTISDDPSPIVDPAPAPRVAPVAPAPPVALTSPKPAPAPTPKPESEAEARGRMSQVTGEMSSNVQLKQADPAVLAARRAEKKATAAPAAAAPAGGPKPAAAPAGGSKPAFRETMWFYKGEVESAMAAEGSEEAAKPPDEEDVSPEELSAKYADDGSLSDEVARRLSLRTGKTQMMQNVGIPKGSLPGEKMGDQEMIGEIAGQRRYYVWGAVAIVVLAAIGGLLYILL